MRGGDAPLRSTGLALSDLTAILGPALLAGIVAILATVAVERFGGRLGGVLASLPTTIVPASLGMWWGADHPEAYVAAMAAVPAGMVVDAGFLWSWRVLPRRQPSAWSLHTRLGAMSVLSLGAWFVGATLFVLGMGALADAGVTPMLVGGAALAIQLGAGVWACTDAPPSPRGGRRVSPLMLLGRGLLAGTAIGVSVLVAASGAPLAGGVASVFPAIFLTTMVSLWLAQGEAVPVGAVGPIMLGSSSVSAFALVAATLVPLVGLGVGLTLSWVAAVACVSVPAAWWLRRS